MDNKVLLRMHTVLNETLGNERATRKQLLAALESVRKDVIAERCRRFAERYPNLVREGQHGQRA